MCAGDPLVRAVDVVGGTGAGKSTIGNCVLEQVRGQGFTEGLSAESETTEVKTLEHNVSLEGGQCYTLHWSDTQGINDTQGRTVDFLDHIVEHMRTNPPNGIVLTYNAEQKDTASVKLGYKAMRLCFNESLPDGRTILVMNKLKPLDDLSRNFPTDKEAEAEWNKIYEDHLENIRASLGMESGLSNVVPVEMGSLRRAAPWIKAIRTRIFNFSETPMDCSRFKTFSEVLELAKNLDQNAVNAVSAADNCIKDIESRNANIKGDIQWHEDRVEHCTAGLKTAAAGTTVALGIISFGIGAAVVAGTVAALAAALADSNSKLPLLRDQVKMNDDYIETIKGDMEGNLERERAKYRAFLEEIKQIQNVMGIQVDAAATAMS